MTGEQLFEGWRKAAQALQLSVLTWFDLSPQAQKTWDEVASIIGEVRPDSGEHLLQAFDLSMAKQKLGSQPRTPGIVLVANELVDKWAGYYFGGQATSSENNKGDVWVFKASGLRGKVVDVDGSKLRLRLGNGTDTDWIEAAELEKSAKKE